jgi:serpin B
MNTFFSPALAFLLAPFFLSSFVRNADAEPPKSPDKNVVQGNNQFSFDLYRQLDKEKPGDNLFFSPASVSLALTMTAAGAKGQTEVEMAKTLHLADILPQAHAEYGQLLKQWNGEKKDRGYQLLIANRLWGQKGFKFLDSYLSLTRKDYGAELGIVDFADQPETARREINAWVEKQTADKIKDLFPKGSIDASTTLVLANAIYFKAAWMIPFEKKRTSDEEFNVSATKKVKVPMMRQKRFFSYMENDALQTLELPYKGGTLSMMVLLPRKIDGVAELEKSLTAEKIDEIRSKYVNREVEMFFPKFKLDSSFFLNKSLNTLGMKSAFGGEADFSGIDGNRDLFISVVVHKAFVDVNETGTEAAAATGIGIAGAMPPKDPPAIFRADRPFIILIRDQVSGAILFLGRVINPELPGK